MKAGLWYWKEEVDDDDTIIDREDDDTIRTPVVQATVLYSDCHHESHGMVWYGDDDDNVDDDTDHDEKNDGEIQTYDVSHSAPQRKPP